MVLAGAKRQLNEKGPRLCVLGLFLCGVFCQLDHLLARQDLNSVGAPALVRGGLPANDLERHSSHSRASPLIRKVKGEVTGEHLICAIQSRTHLCVRVGIEWIRHRVIEGSAHMHSAARRH